MKCMSNIDWPCSIFLSLLNSLLDNTRHKPHVMIFVKIKNKKSTEFMYSVFLKEGELDRQGKEGNHGAKVNPWGGLW